MLQIGLPPNEASRINQYTCNVLIDYEALVMVKVGKKERKKEEFIFISAIELQTLHEVLFACLF